MCKINHVASQSAFTNICERMGRSKELTESERGTVIGCNKFLSSFLFLLDIVLLLLLNQNGHTQ